MGTAGILRWWHNLDVSLRQSPAFVRALSLSLLMECPKISLTSPLPKKQELEDLFQVGRQLPTHTAAAGLRRA